MGLLQTLLDQAEPLDSGEIIYLQECLEVLEEDVRTFGPTPDDIARMIEIRRRLARSQPATHQDPGSSSDRQEKE